jgi:CspA family cold shock protein
LTTGSVKWFNGQKGYGFILDDTTKTDVFVHYSAIVEKENEFRTLNEGDKVTFEIVAGKKGNEARNVEVTEAAPRQERAPRRRFESE